MATGVTIDFNANLARFTSAIDKATADLNRFQRNTDRIAGQVKGAFIALGGTAVVGGLAAMVKSSINAADELSKLSQRVGFTVESLSALKYAGDLSDVSLDQLSTGLKQLSKNMNDTAAGTGEARDAFKAMGLEVTNSNGQIKNSEQILTEIADRFAGMQDGAGKTALAMRIFGKSGAELIPLLNNGSAGLRGMADEANRLGLVISGDTARAAVEFNDNLTRLKSAATGFGYALAKETLPALTAITTAMAEAVKEGRGLYSLWVALGGLGAFLFTDEFADNATKLKKLEEDLSRLLRIKEKSTGVGVVDYLMFGDDASDLDKRIAKTRQQIAALRTAMADAQKAGGADKRKAAPLLPGTGTGGGKTGRAGADPLAGLLGQTETAKLAEYTKTLALLDARYAANKISANQYAEALLILNERLDADLNFGKSLAGQDSALQDLRERWIDILDPVEQYRKKLDEIDKLVEAGLFDDEQAAAARLIINEQIDGLGKVSEALKDQKSIAEELGLTFTSAFEDAIVEGKKFSDVLKGLEQDILRIITRKLVTEPLGNFVSNQISGIDFGSIFSSFFGGARASGGPVYPGRAFLVGEDGPELFVPKSAGNIMPNGTMGGAPVYQSITFMVQGTPDRRSQQQMAAAVYEGALLAARRNN